MKTVKIFLLAAIATTITSISFAQAKTETLKVSGECGMCKKKIEKAAKDAGATYALWNQDTKILTVKYNSTSTNTAKIEKKIAGVGYDTPDFKATEEAYKKLDECCQYERTLGAACATKCGATGDKCKDEADCKAKGCSKDMAACKTASCCKKAEQ